jgi:hypothetical protein
MGYVFFALLMALNFGMPFAFGYFGDTSTPVWISLVWSPVMATQAVPTGWRAPKASMLGSWIVGTCFAALWCVPTFFIGRWLS